MLYDDGLITFEIPPTLKNRTVKRLFSSWRINSRKLNFTIELSYATAMMPYFDDYYRREIRSAKTHIGYSGIICHCHGPYQTTINNHCVDYCFLISEVKGMPGLFVPLCKLTISHDQYLVYVEISINDRVKTNSFPIDDYWQSISSIKVIDFEKLKQEIDDIARKNVIKYSKPPQLIPVNIPADFKEFPSIIPMQGGRLFKKEGFEIHIIDLTGIGREADID
ncbi:MAG: hypothetical protein LBC20_01295, partial [Planctomycetaceae bacterium]|nr:hypothetical protein [Planctomycetaceae bacterium]